MASEQPRTRDEPTNRQAHIDLGHFDAVIVGSGFGGSVMAYRLADAGRKVLVLERGKAYPPGSFARTPEQMRTNWWAPDDGLYGLYDLWSFKGIEALVSSGLGGGSLIYANVFLRKDPSWFVEDLDDGGTRAWPVTYDDLVPHYEAVERMIGVQTYPFGSSTPKAIALHRAAAVRGHQAFYPPLAVTFANSGAEPAVGEPIVEEYPNLHGAARFTCRLVGECDVGCNWGAKNSLDYNYLSAAKRAGARIETLHEVTEFEPRDGDGYTVRFERHDPSDASAQPGSVTASRLIISSGALGSPYLLLRNRELLGGLPARMGTRFSGNGDLLMVAMRCLDEQHEPAAVDPTFGAVITSAVRFPDEADGAPHGARGFYLEDAGYPLFGAWLAESGDVPPAFWRALRYVWRGFWDRARGDPRSNLSGEISRIIGDTGLSHSTFPLLSMGRDVADGKMSLTGNGRLEVDWTTKTSEAYFARVRSEVTAIGNAMGAKEVIDNPLWHLRRVITVHALGGCPMAARPDEGVVNARDGEVFGHPGLHVADGSVMPSAVGPNPSLTIAAVSDRFADGILGISARPPA
jgi:cholesterol oxidase